MEKPLRFLLHLFALSLGCTAKPDNLEPAAKDLIAAQLESSELAANPDRYHTNAHFSNVATEWGVEFIATNGEELEHFSILETLGVGIACCDFQNDGRLDIIVPGGGTFGPGPTVRGRSSELYFSHGSQFVPSAEAAGLATDSLYSHAAVVADYNQDGFSDVLITGFGGVKLFQNYGDGSFEEVSAFADLSLASWSTGAAWGDINQDGHLDLYITNYLDWSFDNHPACYLRERSVCSPIKFAGLHDRLFYSDGEGGFTPVRLPVPADGKGLASLMADLDLDGDLDIYVANDTTPNFLFENLGHGKLREIGIASGTAFGEMAEADGSMGIDVGDYNGDGRLDLWVANFEGQSFALYENLGSLIFEHVSAFRGINAVGGEYVGFGTAFFDFDYDGDEDIVAVNGHVTPVSGNAPFRQLPILFENLRGERFVNVASQAGGYFTQQHMARGLGLGDLDGDADLDFAVAHTNEPVAIIRNETAQLGHWVRFRLIGRSSPRTPVGAIVRLREPSGKVQVKTFNSGTSYLSTHEPLLSFGLGHRPESPIEVQVHWPSGAVQSIQLKEAAFDQEILLIEPE